MTTKPTEISPGVWQFRVYAGRGPNGSPIQIKRTVRGGIRAAEREKAKLEAEVAAGKHRGTGENVDGLLDLWLDHCATRLQPTTVREYRRLAETTVRPAIGKIRLAKLTARDLDKLYGEMTSRGLKPATIRRVHSLIGAALNQAERWDMVDRNVARRATPPKVHAAQVAAPTPAEVGVLVAAATEIEPMLANLLLLAALTGARRGELCALRWTDLDWVRSTLTIERSVYETQGGGWALKAPKTHAARRIVLDELSLETLRRHRADVEQLAADLDLEIPAAAFMFSRSPQGLEPIRPDLVSKFAVRVAKKANVECHLHSLRHFSASQMIGNGVDVRTAAGRLGHADASVTLRTYAHVLPEADRDAAAIVGRTLTCA